MFLVFTELSDPVHYPRVQLYFVYIYQCAPTVLTAKLFLLMTFYHFVYYISRESNETTYFRSAQIINCFISLQLTKDSLSLYKQCLCHHLVCARIIRICKYIYLYQYKLFAGGSFFVQFFSDNPLILRGLLSSKQIIEPVNPFPASVTCNRHNRPKANKQLRLHYKLFSFEELPFSILQTFNHYS